MVIDDFDLAGRTVLPTEADAPLVIDTDTPLSASPAAQRFEPIARRGAQKIEGGCGVQLAQLALRNPLDSTRQLGRKPTMEGFFGFLAGKRYDHMTILSRRDTIVKPRALGFVTG